MCRMILVSWTMAHDTQIILRTRNTEYKVPDEKIIFTYYFESTYRIYFLPLINCLPSNRARIPFTTRTIHPCYEAGEAHCAVSLIDFNNLRQFREGNHSV